MVKWFVLCFLSVFRNELNFSTETCDYFNFIYSFNYANFKDLLVDYWASQT